MTLDEFIKQAPLTLASYAARFRELSAEDPAGMQPERQRAEEWWWRDVSCYLRLIEFEERTRRERTSA